MKKVLKFAVVALIIVACAKKKTDDPQPVITVNDSQNPTITYLMNLNSLYSPAAKVKLNFKVTDNYKLKYILYRVKNTGIDSVYLNKTINTSLKDYTVLDSVIVNLTTTMADFEVFVQAEDSTGNKATSTKTFHVM